MELQDPYGGMRQDQKNMVAASGTPEGRNNPMEDPNFDDIKIGGGGPSGDAMQDQS